MGEFQFQGFDMSNENCFFISDAFFQHMMQMSLCEERIVAYLMRRSWSLGTRRGSKWSALTLDEFEHGEKNIDGTRMDKGAGLSRPSIIKGLRLLEERGCLQVKVDNSNKRQPKKFYRLRRVPS